jgi:hypothetical protein
MCPVYTSGQKKPTKEKAAPDAALIFRSAALGPTLRAFSNGLAVVGRKNKWAEYWKSTIL